MGVFAEFRSALDKDSTRPSSVRERRAREETQASVIRTPIQAAPSERAPGRHVERSLNQALDVDNVRMETGQKAECQQRRTRQARAVGSKS